VHLYTNKNTQYGILITSEFRPFSSFFFSEKFVNFMVHFMFKKKITIRNPGAINLLSWRLGLL